MISNYLKTLLKHKYYVFRECVKLGIPFRGLIHDNSKFSISEYLQYKKYFSVDDPDEKTKKEFDLAWLHHIIKNKHHWNHWVIIDDEGLKPLEMPEVYIKEMVADYKGFGYTYNGFDDSLQYYKLNKNKMLLHPNTRKKLEYYLGYDSKLTLKLGEKITYIQDDNIQLYGIHIINVNHNDKTVTVKDDCDVFSKYLRYDKFIIHTSYKDVYICKINSIEQDNYTVVLDILE